MGQDGALWVELSIEAESELVEPLVELFNRYGLSPVLFHNVGFNVDDGERMPERSPARICAYIPMDERFPSIKNNLDIGLKLLNLIKSIPPLVERTISANEWEKSWKSHFNIMKVGKTMVICPTWQNYKPGKGETVIFLDPGLAFGTGYHPTTRMCLEELEARVNSGMKILDIGIGSGILTIAAAKLGASEMVGIDIDITAVKAASSNIKINELEERIKISQGTLLDDKLNIGQFHLIVANLSTEILTRLFKEIENHLLPDGILIASGILYQRKGQVLKEIEKTSLHVIKERKLEDWVAIVAVNR